MTHLRASLSNGKPSGRCFARENGFWRTCPMKFARAGYVSWPKSMSEPMTRPDGLVRWIAACAIFSLALATVFGFVVRGQDGSGRTLGFLLLTLMVGLTAIYKMSVRLNDVLFL